MVYLGSNSLLSGQHEYVLVQNNKSNDISGSSHKDYSQ